MTTILSTNARELYDSDGDFIRYDTPSTDPVSIRTKFVKAVRPLYDDIDEMVYVVTWEGGIWADMFSIPVRWQQMMNGRA